MSELLDRITVSPEQCGGQPCIRGMRIRVVDILDLLGAGLTAEQVLDELPDLEKKDITAALLYAAGQPNDPLPPADRPVKQPDGGLFSKLRKISIKGPEDFSENLDRYLAGEKNITNGTKHD